jgi:hypothetical protein
MNRTTPRGKGLALILGLLLVNSATFAAGVDSRNYTCPELQRLILFEPLHFHQQSDL